MLKILSYNTVENPEDLSMTHRFKVFIEVTEEEFHYEERVSCYACDSLRSDTELMDILHANLLRVVSEHVDDVVLKPPSSRRN